MTMNTIIRNSITVELLIAAAAINTPYNFPDIPNLRQGGGLVKTYGIIAHCKSVDYTTSSLQNPITTAAQLQEATLTLYVAGQQVVWYLPLYQLVATSNGGFIRQFADMEIDITKSFVQINDITTTAWAANTTVALTFLYK